VSTHNDKPANPGQLGKDGEHNAMDRQRSGQPAVPNPGNQGGSQNRPVERNRPGQSGEPGGLGSQQADDEGGIGGQGLGNRQVDDNQDDLGRDVNEPRRPSTNNENRR
jgi:hypothetical protein